MRKVSYYIVAIVVIGIATASFWTYLRYFKSVEQPFLYFSVDRGDIQEAVKVRSEVVSQKTFDLEFPFSGTVETVYAHEGDIVLPGQLLMKLNTKDFEIQAEQLQAVVSERKADLAKIEAGATADQVNVSRSRLSSAQIAAIEAEKNLVDKIKDAYTKSDDAIRAKTDQLFDNPRSSTPALNIPADSQTKITLDFQRLTLESTLNNWSASLANISTIASSTVDYTNIAKQNLASISEFLNIISPSVNNLVANANLSQATIDSYKSNISAARTSINAAIANLVAAEEKSQLAAANVTLAQSELNLELGAPRVEDVAAAEARLKESQSALDAVNEQISKSLLTSPVTGKIVKINYEVGEVFRPGQAAISLVAGGYKLQADVSELDIAKVHESDTNNVQIELDAFPGQKFWGRVMSVDPQEVIKTEDKYYRVNIAFDAPDILLRPGMSADATILSGLKKNVLRVSELAIYTDGKNKYVKALLPGLDKAASNKSTQITEVQTGISDGEFVEILGGLQEGQVVVASAE